MRRPPRTRIQAAVAVELARAGLSQADLAHRMGVRPTTLSGWLTGASPAPTGLAADIEQALGLVPGALPRPEEVPPTN
jgi:DNA-binding transcriptional regulator YdaS (Cro superfamily)